MKAMGRAVKKRRLSTQFKRTKLLIGFGPLICSTRVDVTSPLKLFLSCISSKAEFYPMLLIPPNTLLDFI